MDMTDQCMNKNRLQEYAQRSGLPLPWYQTINEGPLHAPQYRSTVVVDGATFVSPCTFVKIKAAEQFVAKFALESIANKIKHEGVPLIQNDTTFCKAILYEYAKKTKLGDPTYTTSQLAGLLPTFSSSVAFDGKTHIGGVGRNKKEAEQIAARTAIEWILGQSDTRIIMSEIIKSKGRLFDSIRGDNVSPLTQDKIIPLEDSVENHSSGVLDKEKDDYVVPMNDKLLAHVISPILENSKEGDIREMCSEHTSGHIGGSTIEPALSPDPPLGSTSGLVSNDVSHVQIIQVKSEKSEVPSDIPPVLPEECPNVNHASGKKRLHKKNGKRYFKKTRRNH